MANRAKISIKTTNSTTETGKVAKFGGREVKLNGYILVHENVFWIFANCRQAAISSWTTDDRYSSSTVSISALE
jgi:hypothetical protein